MEIAGPLTPFHVNLCITSAINNPHSIPMGLSIVDYESLEVWLWNFMLKYYMDKVLSENYLSILVFKLEVTIGDGYDVLVCPIVDVVCHGGLTDEPLYMVGHDLHIFKINATMLSLTPNLRKYLKVVTLFRRSREFNSL